jgi:uncharacterized membrane protein
MREILAILPALALAACYPPPPPPPITPNPPGGVYRATGTEPFWGLTIDGRQMVFTLAGTSPITEPTPRVIVGIAGEIYQTPRLSVNIVHTQCSDGMSDRTYPDTVQITADGHHYEGCGGL